MSRGGRRRLLTAGMRTVAGVAFLGAMAWGAWILIGGLAQGPRTMPTVVGAVPVKPPELKTNGVLGRTWLARRLAVPANASLMDLDLGQLQARLLADGQVLTATLTRNFPDRLEVAVTERLPIARVMAEWLGRQQPLLVARDGVIFAGEGYEPSRLERLPWLDGISIARREGMFLPIEGMGVVAELLARAREADPGFELVDSPHAWRVLSLARLAADREIEVRTASGVTVVFSARGDFFRQIAKLDFLWEALAHSPQPPARIDLTLGREVPVMVHPPAPARPPAGLHALPSQLNIPREL
jgi:cell division protein FtsQ